MVNGYEPVASAEYISNVWDIWDKPNDITDILESCKIIEKS